MNTNADDEWYKVSFSLPWTVYNAPTGQDAISIAVSELGKGIADLPDTIRNTEIAAQTTVCGSCGVENYALLTIAGKALVGLTLTAEVQANSVETGGRHAQRAFGERLPDIPLTLLDRPH